MKTPVTAVVTSFLGLALAACGSAATQETGPEDFPDRQMTQAELVATGHVATDLVGTWVGTLAVDQSIGGVASSASVTTSVEFDARSLPTRLPALGFVGSWQTYDAANGSSGSGVADRLAAGDTGGIYVFCADEADGSANAMTLDPVNAIAARSSFAWRYRAAYRFADLLAYEGYGYAAPGVPSVTMSAVDSYTREGDVLYVSGQATGVDSSGRVLSFEMRGELHQGALPTLAACRLQ
jgi:hypothetical protein